MNINNTKHHPQLRKGDKKTTETPDKRKNSNRIIDDEVVTISDTKMTEGKDEGSQVHKKNKYNNLITPRKKLLEGHKKINHNSKNRRKCDRLQDDNSNSTPEKCNLSNFAHENLTRFTLKLSIPASDDPSNTIINIFNEFIKELGNSDNTAAILPWAYADRKMGSLNQYSVTPENMGQTKIYLNKLWNVNPGEKRTLYPSVFIGHGRDIEEVK